MNIATIKAAQLAARKARNALKATLLTTLIGEAEMIGKSAGNRESTDAEVLQVIRKFEKGMKETLKYLADMNVAETDARVVVVVNELEILQEFLPQKMSDADVQTDISALMSALALPFEQKSMGIVVKELKARYSAQFDGQQVSAVFKGLMA